jgi:hypothetical protein
MWRKMSIYKCMLNNYWWQKSDIWSQASYRYLISWEAFFDPSDSYFLFAEEQGYHKWAFAHSSSCFILLTGPKTLPTIWHTYMKLVAEYQIPVINSCLENCDEKGAYMFNVSSDSYFLFADLVGFYTHLTYICICSFFVTFFSATIDENVTKNVHICICSMCIKTN